MTERTEKIREAVAACYKAHKTANYENIKYSLPDDFFYDFDAGKDLDDVTAFREIQEAIGGNTVKENWPDAPDIDPAPPQVVAPVAELAAPQASQPASHAASGPGPSSQERLDAARRRESDLIGERQSLANAQRNARAAVAEALIAYQQIDPHRQTHEDLAREYIRASAEQRAARKRGESWAIPPENKRRGEIAYVDLERKYERGSDANAFARKMNVTGNRRGAYSRKGGTNTDPSRGATPQTAAQRRATIPALGK